MDGTFTKADIVNWALADLGMSPKFSIDADDSLSGQVKIFWPRTEAQTFTLTDWTFCRRTVALARIDGTPPTGYPYAFALPTDTFGPPHKYLSDPLSALPVRDVRLEGDEVHARVPVLYATVSQRLEPSAWAPAFANAFAKALAANLAVPLTSDPDMQLQLLRDAFGTPSQNGTGGLFGRLIAQDKAAGPIAQSISDNDPLTAGRFGPSVWSGRW